MSFGGLLKRKSSARRRKQSLAPSTSSDSGCSDIYTIVPQTGASTPKLSPSPAESSSGSCPDHVDPGAPIPGPAGSLQSPGSAPPALVPLVPRLLSSFSRLCTPQDMVSVQTFLDFIRKQDLGRIKYALRESHFDINSKDEVSTTISNILCCCCCCCCYSCSYCCCRV